MVVSGKKISEMETPERKQGKEIKMVLKLSLVEHHLFSLQKILTMLATLVILSYPSPRRFET